LSDGIRLTATGVHTADITCTWTATATNVNGQASGAFTIGIGDVVELTKSLFVGTDNYDLTALRTDLVRFTFLLGHDDGEQLFGTDEP